MRSYPERIPNENDLYMPLSVHKAINVIKWLGQNDSSLYIFRLLSE